MWTDWSNNPKSIRSSEYAVSGKRNSLEKGSILFLRELARRSVPVAVMGIMLTASLFFDSTATAFPTDVGGSWNGSVPCSSTAIVRISDITNNMTGSSSFASSPFSPGITENPYVSGSQGAKRWLTPGATPPGWHSPGPSCSITNSMGQTIASFVEINGVGRAFWNYQDCSASYDTVNGGTPTPSGHWCDSYGNLFDTALVPK